MNDVPLLQVKGLKKYFPIVSGVFRKHVGNVKAVDGVDFTIPEGKIVGLVGESGCGKSTAARSSIRLLEPTAGQIFFRGQDITLLDQESLKKLRREMQMVFQDPLVSLNPRKTVGVSIGEGLRYHGMVTDPDLLRARVIEVLGQVGLSDDVIGRYPHEFSGGQLQRICIARALALEPKLVICDEAVSALDVSVQGQIINLLVDLQKRLGLSYLFIAHDLSVVRHICDHVVVMYLGKVMESAPAEELFANPKHPYTQALLSAVPKNHPNEKTKRIILKGEIPSPINPPSGCPFRTRCPYAQPECREPPPRRHAGPNHFYDCILE
ncbi:MAG: ABC transporter ATP-binding protein [Chlamydiales bacterium]|nr:ABC transporter ATP-binding protein [Chlamydiales bacterium]